MQKETLKPKGKYQLEWYSPGGYPAALGVCAQKIILCIIIYFGQWKLASKQIEADPGLIPAHKLTRIEAVYVVHDCA